MLKWGVDKNAVCTSYSYVHFGGSPNNDVEKIEVKEGSQGVNRMKSFLFNFPIISWK